MRWRLKASALVVTVVCQIRAECREREVLKDEASQQPSRDLQRQHRKPDERHERDHPEPRRREDRSDGRDADEQQDDAEDAGDLPQPSAHERDARTTAVLTLTSSTAITICVSR